MIPYFYNMMKTASQWHATTLSIFKSVFMAPQRQLRPLYARTTNHHHRQRHRHSEIET